MLGILAEKIIEKPALPFKEGPLNISIDGISAASLINTGTLLDKQDPGLVIKIGNQYTFQTDRVQDGGTDVERFPESFKDIVVRYEDLEHGLEIIVEAHNMDKNNSSKKLLGVGKAKLTDILKTYDKKYPFTVQLDTKGTITMSIMIAIGAKFKEKSTGYHYHYSNDYHYYINNIRTIIRSCYEAMPR